MSRTVGPPLQIIDTLFLQFYSCFRRQQYLNIKAISKH
jgi:hypothetical protein